MILTLAKLLGSKTINNTNLEGVERHEGRDISLSESVKDLITLVRADKIKSSPSHQQALSLAMSSLKKQEKALLRTKERVEESVQMQGYKSISTDDV